MSSSGAPVVPASELPVSASDGSSSRASTATSLPSGQPAPERRMAVPVRVSPASRATGIWSSSARSVIVWITNRDEYRPSQDRTCW